MKDANVMVPFKDKTLYALALEDEQLFKGQLRFVKCLVQFPYGGPKEFYVHYRKDEGEWTIGDCMV